jgi:tRNA(fMet)-specific endonuclease VapC
MIRYMLDTNTCIYVIKRKPTDVINRFRRIQISQIGISSIKFLAPLEILSYDDEAAQHYGRLRANLEKRGTPVGSLYMLIAAHALSAGCILITNNEREFKRVHDLKVDNWVK